MSHAKHRTSVIISLTTLYLLLSLPGWQSLSSTTLHTTVDWSMLLHPVLISQLLLFATTHLLILLAALTLCFSVAHVARRLNKRLYTPAAFGTFILLAYALLGFALQHYPWLELAIISDSLSATSPYQQIGKIAFLSLSGLLLFSFLYNLKFSRKIAASQLLAILFFITPLTSTHLPKTLESHAASVTTAKADTQRQQPDIIMVGLDSVSLYQARQNAERMPFVASLLNRGVTFEQAFTPLGRTYGAWNSILSGRHPKHHGARFNLTEFRPDQIRQMLPTDLKELGYHNIYTQDERRFNNINEEYGFDTTVGPAVGAIDFIIPLFADHLFTAYFTNSEIGRWLLPSLYNNRASSITYDPSVFVDSILQASEASPGNKPLFMASHFCLAHFPYRWRTFAAHSANNQQEETSLYRQSLAALDQQIEALFKGLQRQGRLDNAIVIVLSDHGEGLGMKPPLWVDWPDTLLNNTALGEFSQILRGHGNSLLSRDQNNVILNIFQSTSRVPARTIETPVSLVDIRPTILSLLEQPVSHTVDGIAIPPAVQHAQRSRYLFMETGMMMDLPQPDATASELAAKVKDSAAGYIINPQGRLIINEDFIHYNESRKQFGVVHNDHLLISTPNNSNNFLLVNRKSKQWAKMTQTELKKSEQSHLLDALNCYSGHAKACSLTPPAPGS